MSWVLVLTMFPKWEGRYAEFGIPEPHSIEVFGWPTQEACEAEAERMKATPDPHNYVIYRCVPFSELHP